MRRITLYSLLLYGCARVLYIRTGAMKYLLKSGLLDLDFRRWWVEDILGQGQSTYEEMEAGDCMRGNLLVCFLGAQHLWWELWGISSEGSLRTVGVLRGVLPRSPYNSIYSGNIRKFVWLRETYALRAYALKKGWFPIFVCQKSRVPYIWWKPIKHLAILMSTSLGNFFWDRDADHCYQSG